MRKKLEEMLEEWRKKQKYFHDASTEISKDGEESFASNRYEGEGIGIRWCIEDLERVLGPF